MSYFLIILIIRREQTLLRRKVWSRYPLKEGISRISSIFHITFCEKSNCPLVIERSRKTANANFQPLLSGLGRYSQYHYKWVDKKKRTLKDRKQLIIR